MKTALIGYGKMGKAIEEVLKERGHEVVARFDRSGIEQDALSRAEVAIEFTRPEAVVTNLATCFDQGVPVVCGTTGWLASYDEIAQLCREQKGALLYASNFSLGVNIFFALNRYLAQIMDNFDQYDLGIHEIHHTEKLDAPSGTAITLAEDAIESLQRKQGYTMEEAHDRKQIRIKADRIENVPGTHRVTYTSEIDNINLEHVAHSRKGFALGAVMAAEFLKGKKGVYNMKDVLKI